MRDPFREEKIRQIVDVMAPLIHLMIKAEGERNFVLKDKLEKQLDVECQYLFEISKVPPFHFPRE